jgi:hypothetical protein
VCHSYYPTDKPVTVRVRSGVTVTVRALTAVAVGQMKRAFSGVRVFTFTWFYLSSMNISG